MTESNWKRSSAYIARLQIVSKFHYSVGGRVFRKILGLLKPARESKLILYLILCVFCISAYVKKKQYCRHVCPPVFRMLILFNEPTETN